MGDEEGDEGTGGVGAEVGGDSVGLDFGELFFTCIYIFLWIFGSLDLGGGWMCGWGW